MAENGIGSGIVMCIIVMGHYTHTTAQNLREHLLCMALVLRLQLQ